ncbi:hypothetical protein J7399_04755 [Shimia sp. R9_1]|uniref:hypothetical protein n=1 Tax=unclassified Shimia TaxID=2630038 RepID=UPI001ADA3E50|nr:MULTISPECIES: hypothetical protein [unclassified Shimia]MBO9398248.1 hypothetical protein [Shimia sp. R9_2]MBO9401294.1 hypothetical protein [Shimia sp. R9_3]MBO9406729.1 hypothetical protein [Shimia sp. R9_1]
MTTRTTADVLATISKDVADLASIAHALDNLTSELDLSGADQSKIRDLQRVDALFQHLDDIAVLLGNMSNMIGAGPDLNVQDLKDSVRLDYLKSRLANADQSIEMSPDAGAVNLF